MWFLSSPPHAFEAQMAGPQATPSATLAVTNRRSEPTVPRGETSKTQLVQACRLLSVGRRERKSSRRFRARVSSALRNRDSGRSAAIAPISSAGTNVPSTPPDRRIRRTVAHATVTNYTSSDVSTGRAGLRRPKLPGNNRSSPTPARGTKRGDSSGTKTSATVARTPC